MKTLKEIRSILKSNNAILKEEYNVEFIGIFGSYSRNEAIASSDIDILIEFSESPDIFRFIKLEDLLSDMIGIKVDLVTKKALKPMIRDNILKEVVAAWSSAVISFI